MESFKQFILSEEKKEYEILGKKGTRREWKKQVTLWNKLYGKVEKAKTRKALLKLVQDGDAKDIFSGGVESHSDHDIRVQLSNYFENNYIELINNNTEILKKNNEYGKY